MNRIPIADIRRLTIHDGPGTRTTVFVKGCPLRCLWCHNPETFSGIPQLIFRKNLCSNCRKCETVCAHQTHTFSDAGHQLERSRCIRCGACVEICLHNALEICGKMMSAEELLPVLMKDKLFYQTGGGVTISGGEPLLYPDFIADIFAMLKSNGVHTAIDTSGEVPFEAFEKVLPFTDMFLFDLKGMNPEQHQKNTGKSNTRIHENLARLGNMDRPIEIRMPVIPGCNDADQEFHDAGKFLQHLPAVRAVKLLPYHEMAREKYLAAGIPDTMPAAETPDTAFLSRKAAILQQYIQIPIRF